MDNNFVIAPHMRLHEWVGVEKGYFDDEGLVYKLEDQLKSATNHVHDLGTRLVPIRPLKRAGRVMSAAPATGQSTLRRHLGMGACMEKPIPFRDVVFSSLLILISGHQKIWPTFPFRLAISREAIIR